MRFEFATASRIVFGSGRAADAGRIVREFGTRALVVTGRSPDRFAGLAASLEAAGVRATRFPVAGEPTVDAVRHGVAVARDESCDVVVGFGGGSAIDAAKAIAAMLGNGGDVFEHLEVIGGGVPLTRPSVPWVAVPTTAGTGSEVTRNAVLASPEHGVKVSLRSPTMLARVALVDPELTFALPPGPTASSGLDALAQLVEPFTSIRANPLTDSICREGIGRVAGSLRAAFRSAVAVSGGAPGTGSDVDTASAGLSGLAEGARRAREDMSLGALFGGLALSNAGLGAAHGFAAPIGGAFPAPHGTVCGCLLPLVVEANVRALRSREPQSPTLDRYAEVARIVTSRAGATADDLVGWLADLVAELGVPGLGSYGIAEGDIPALVEAAAKASSMQANPVRLTAGEMTGILRRAL